ncbi:hypothetical protein W02_17080 [Nitrospira sp. KM1]|uniref:hypothetical protein n=1 Tax=Nitrospira sp. KM1 TaxID=1936990 RepID=UPI0013A7627F|nr:hypothetical protein [Nitrospira sp. KM1]BCA54568.1 hypothetical protein W02_17080 [Nitrospira sp. KM1]
MRLDTIHRRWAIPSLIMAALLSAGCPRILYLNYQPSTSVRGSGEVQVDTFVYAGHPTGLMKRKEVESSGSDSEALFLSQDIAVFFTNAVKDELTFAGYTVQSSAARVVSGTIKQFYLEYVGAQDQHFQLDVDFHVTGHDAAGNFETSCEIDRRQTRDWMKTGILIEGGIRECIAIFMNKVRTAGVLQPGSP